MCLHQGAYVGPSAACHRRGWAVKLCPPAGSPRRGADPPRGGLRIEPPPERDPKAQDQPEPQRPPLARLYSASDTTLAGALGLRLERLMTASPAATTKTARRGITASCIRTRPSQVIGVTRLYRVGGPDTTFGGHRIECVAVLVHRDAIFLAAGADFPSTTPEPVAGDAIGARVSKVGHSDLLRTIRRDILDIGTPRDRPIGGMINQLLTYLIARELSSWRIRQSGLQATQAKCHCRRRKPRPPHISFIFCSGL